MQIGGGLTSISALWIGQILAAGAAFLLQVMLARALGPVGYGILASALAMSMLAVPVAGFGIGGYLLRLFGSEGFNAYRWIRALSQLISITVAIAVLLMLAWAMIHHSASQAKAIIPILIPHMIAYVAFEIAHARYQLEGKYLGLAIWLILPNTTRLAFVALLMLGTAGNPSLIQTAVSYSLAGMVLFALSAPSLIQLYRSDLRLEGHHMSGLTAHQHDKNRAAPSVGELLLGIWPFGIAGVLYIVLAQGQVVLVETLAGSEAAGVFGSAAVVLAAISLLPSAIFQKFLLPRIHRWATHDPEALKKAYELGNLAMICLGLLVGMSVYLAAPVIITMAFGAQFEPAIAVLQLLAFCIPLRFLSSSAGAVLVTEDNMRRKVWLIAIAATASISAGWLLIPAHAAMGAAIALLAGEAILALSQVVVANRYALRNRR